MRSGDRVVGVLALTPTGEFFAILAPAVILATGGIGGLYARTTNPPEVTGDGLAVAARAGAALADLEFVQFHPTALDVNTDPAPLLTEALRGEGAVLLNDRGERFMRRQHPDAELAPHDVLARAIWEQRARGHAVYLDASEAIGREFPRRFPNVYREAVAAGLDPCSAGLPVTPAEHYLMGGIATDSSGQTSLPGLWAVGEVAATALHGANRLASNSLLEAMVLAAAASRSVARSKLPHASLKALKVPDGALSAHDGRDNACQDAVRALMWNHVGLVRCKEGLEMALRELEFLQLSATRTRHSIGERNALLVAHLIATAALKRRESRGAHSRSDYPQADPALQSRSFVYPEPVPLVALTMPARQVA